MEEIQSFQCAHPAFLSLSSSSFIYPPRALHFRVGSREIGSCIGIGYRRKGRAVALDRACTARLCRLLYFYIYVLKASLFFPLPLSFGTFAVVKLFLSINPSSSFFSIFPCMYKYQTQYMYFKSIIDLSISFFSGRLLCFVDFTVPSSSSCISISLSPLIDTKI